MKKQYTSQFLLRMRTVSVKSCTEKIIVVHNFFFENRAVYGIKWEKVIEPDR
jgi:hypothetical protein